MENQLPAPNSISSDKATWLIGRSSDQPLMSVTLATEQVIPAGADKVDPAQLGIDRLGPLLQTLPNLVVANDVAQSRYMEVVINGPLAAAADGNGLRAFSRDGSKITEHARLFEPEKLQQLVSSAAMFQIASAVVAQKHLADISAKLSEIQAGVEGIATFLLDERKSTVKGALSYLKQVAPAILAGELSPVVRQKLEDIEMDLGAIHDQLEGELIALSKEAEDHKAPGIFETAAALTTALKTMQGKSSDRAEEWALCMGTRLVACRLLNSFPGEPILIRQRQTALHKAGDDFLGASGHLSRFKDVVESRAKGLTSYLDSQSTLQAHRLSLREWGEESLPVLLTGATNQIGQLQQLMVEQQSPVRVMVEMRGNECVAAYHTSATIR